MIYRITVVVAGLVGLYIAVIGVAYLAGYRVYKIPTSAMRPTIEKDESVVGRLSDSYRDHVRRFDLVIYLAPQATGQLYTKRIIGLPGERIVIDASGVTIDGTKLSLPSSVSPRGFAIKGCDLVIPPDTFFVLGDFTENAADSRYLGPVPKQDVIGYLVFKK